MENKEFELTPKLRRMYDLMTALSDAQVIVAKPYGFWKRSVDTKAVIELAKMYAEAKSNFWIRISRGKR